MDLQIIPAAGGMVYRRSRSSSKKMEILIIHRPKYDDWSLPKGKLLTGESWENAARREVKEESGCLVKIQSFAGPVVYLLGAKIKLVLFWKMQVGRSGRFKPTPEVDKIKWVTIAQALKILTYPQEKELISKVGSDY